MRNQRGAYKVRASAAASPRDLIEKVKRAQVSEAEIARNNLALELTNRYMGEGCADDAGEATDAAVTCGLRIADTCLRIADTCGLRIAA